MRTPEQTFGERLRALRRARMLTQVEFAALLGAHATEVSHWETGRNLPRPGRQRQIARALGLTPEAFAATQTEPPGNGDRR